MCDYLSCIPIRLCPLVLLNELPLHDLEPTHFLLYIFHLIIQHKALLVQILQSCLPALVVDLLTVILAAEQDKCCLPVLAQLVLIPAFKATALFLRQLLPCPVMLLVFLPLFIGFDPDSQLKREIVVLLSLALQAVELRVDGLNCRQTPRCRSRSGCSRARRGSGHWRSPRRPGRHQCPQ